jgi:hypothetical protein
LDNKSLDYEGKTYGMPYKIEVTVDGEQVAKLYGKGAGERGMATCIGQRLTMTLTVTQEKGGSEESSTVTLRLPYGMDGIAINLPAYLAGLPEEAYLSEFQVAPEEPEADSSANTSALPTDEFALGDT